MLLAANGVWNTALLDVHGDPFNLGAARELKLFSSKQLRRTRQDVHTRADPFLFAEGGWLYLFLEVQRVGMAGYIEAHRTRDLVAFEALGTILSKPFHLSYPQVFRDGSAVYLLPESIAADEVTLYRFHDFPVGLREERTLLRGAYADSTLFQRDGFWWMFTTSPAGLELFLSRELTGPFKRHPAGVITSDPTASRCGGQVVDVAGALYRPAQDCSERYGGNLSMMRIEEITPTTYRERCERRNIFDKAAPWRSLGGHHISLTTFGGRTIAAVDGQQKDYWINRPISMLLRGASWTTRFGKLTSPIAK